MTESGRNQNQKVRGSLDSQGDCSVCCVYGCESGRTVISHHVSAELPIEFDNLVLFSYLLCRLYCSYIGMVMLMENMRTV